jgi:putative hydrolase of the HAD superfamily
VRVSPKRSPQRIAELVWFFDLDNTLHDASHAIFGAIDARMSAYVARHLAVDAVEASRLRQAYWRRYGATLLGLVRHHAIDASDFLRETHDFDVARMVRAESNLSQLFRRLPGRKVLLTNAPQVYSARVIKALALDRHFGARYTIERMRVHGTYRPKPSRLMFRAMRARERAGRGRAVLVEDSLVNLKAARSQGFRTVLLTLHGTPFASGLGRGARPPYVGLRIGSLHRLPRAVARIRS